MARAPSPGSQRPSGAGLFIHPRFLSLSLSLSLYLSLHFPSLFFTHPPLFLFPPLLSPPLLPFPEEFLDQVPASSLSFSCVTTLCAPVTLSKTQHRHRQVEEAVAVRPQALLAAAAARRLALLAAQEGL